MKNLTRKAAVALTVFALGGCAATSSPPATRPAPFVCHPKAPAQMGECVRQQFEAEGKTPVQPSLTFGAARAQCVDVSVWNGVPNFKAAGVRCVIIQTNDGGSRNSLFYAQVAAAKRAEIPWGVYTFTEANMSGASQAAIALSMSNGRGRSAGVWTDVETPGSYSRACEYINYALAHGVHIAGKYSAPGLVEGAACQGYDWPAEWGYGRAYPLPGYSQARTIIRQNCGTCHLSGFSGQVDRDEDLGLLVLAHPPTPAPKPSRVALLRLRTALRALLTRHRCRIKPYHGRGKYHRLCARWLRAGAVVNKGLRA
jgi:hypothetical protein